MKGPIWDKRRGKPRELYDEAYDVIHGLIVKYKKHPHMSHDRIVGIIAEAFKDARSK